MPRKVTKKLQRKLNPDRKYQSVLVQRLINKSMLDGKKHIAEKAVYSALELAAKKLEAETRLGSAHWQKGRALERRGDKDHAAAESKIAIELLEKTLKARQTAGAGPTDPGLPDERLGDREPRVPGSSRGSKRLQ